MKNKIIEINNKDFPEKLKKIKDMPQKLYAIGNLELLYKDCFAIVGTRRISEYGIKNCQFFSKELVLRDIPIVSGMAIGTDTVAHKTALEYGGTTIAVLGSGFNNIFPESNIDLFEEIISKNGLIITEFEQDIKPVKGNFPKRNRIITALSEGVLVIEAAYRSGTSITAANARKQGKKVFALPGKLDSPVGIGVNRLIKEGAVLTTNVEDILMSYPQFMYRKRKTYEKKVFKEENNLIYQCIDDGKYIDEILEECGLEFNSVIEIITKLEIDNYIYLDIDGRYKKR